MLTRLKHCLACGDTLKHHPSGMGAAKRYCNSACCKRFHYRRAEKKARQKRSKAQWRAAKLGRQCKHCLIYDHEVIGPWSSVSRVCRACDRSRWRTTHVCTKCKRRIGNKATCPACDPQPDVVTVILLAPNGDDRERTIYRTVEALRAAGLRDLVGYTSLTCWCGHASSFGTVPAFGGHLLGHALRDEPTGPVEVIHAKRTIVKQATPEEWRRWR